MIPAVLPDEKVLVSLMEMGLEDEPMRLNETIIQEVFYNYSKTKEYEDLLKEFTFSTTGTFPYSALLERVLIRAKSSRVLKTLNPDYECLQLAKGTREYLEERVIPILGDMDHEKLTQIGKRLSDASQSI